MAEKTLQEQFAEEDEEMARLESKPAKAKYSLYRKFKDSLIPFRMGILILYLMIILSAIYLVYKMTDRYLINRNQVAAHGIFQPLSQKVAATTNPSYVPSGPVQSLNNLFFGNQTPNANKSSGSSNQAYYNTAQQNGSCSDYLGDHYACVDPSYTSTGQHGQTSQAAQSYPYYYQAPQNSTVRYQYPQQSQQQYYKQQYYHQQNYQQQYYQQSYVQQAQKNQDGCPDYLGDTFACVGPQYTIDGMR